MSRLFVACEVASDGLLDKHVKLIRQVYRERLRKAHLGEVGVAVWPKVLKEMCAGKNIFVLE